jgi:hypothetical protein
VTVSSVPAIVKILMASNELRMRYPMDRGGDNEKRRTTPKRMTPEPLRFS